MAAVLRGGPCSLDVLSQVASESLGRESTSSSSTMEWHEHVHRLAELLDERGGKAAGAAAGHLDAGASAVVRQTLSAALHSAKADANWSSSGLPESLQRALDLCERGSVVAACTAAQNLLGFLDIVKRKSGSITRAGGPAPPHGIGKRGAATAPHAASSDTHAGVAPAGAPGSAAPASLQPAGADAAAAAIDAAVEAAEVAAERAARAARLVTSGSSGSGSPGIAEAAKLGVQAASLQVTSGAAAAGGQRPACSPTELRTTGSTLIVLRQAPALAGTPAPAQAGGADAAGGAVTTGHGPGLGSAAPRPDAAAAALGSPKHALAPAPKSLKAASPGRRRGAASPEGPATGGRGRRRGVNAGAAGAAPAAGRPRLGEHFGGRLSGHIITSAGPQAAAGSGSAGYGPGAGPGLGLKPLPLAPAVVGAPPQGSAGKADTRSTQQARWQALSSLAASSAGAQAAGASLAGGALQPYGGLSLGAGPRSASAPNPVRLQVQAAHAPPVLCRMSAPEAARRAGSAGERASAITVDSKGPAPAAPAALLPALPKAPVSGIVTGTRGARALALSPFAEPAEAGGNAPGGADDDAGKAGAGIERAGGSGGSSDSDTSGSDTEKRFAAAAADSEAVRPLKKRRLGAPAALHVVLATSGNIAHASSSGPLDPGTPGPVTPAPALGSGPISMDLEQARASGPAGDAGGGGGPAEARRRRAGSGAGLGAQEPLRSFGSVQALCPEDDPLAALGAPARAAPNAAAAAPPPAALPAAPAPAAGGHPGPPLGPYCAMPPARERCARLGASLSGPVLLGGAAGPDPRPGPGDWPMDAAGLDGPGARAADAKPQPGSGAAWVGLKIRERSLSEGASVQLPIAPLRLSPLAKGAEAPERAPLERTVVWAGVLKHRAAGPAGVSTVELLALSAAVPEPAAEQLPPTLFVTRLAQRAAVRMAHHRLVQCRMGPLSERQAQKLQVLASAKLVAVCRLQHCQLTLVPYLEAGSGALRMIGFLTGDDLGSPV